MSPSAAELRKKKKSNFASFCFFYKLLSFFPFFPLVILRACLYRCPVLFCIVFVMMFNDFAPASIASPPISGHHLLQAAMHLQFWKTSSLWKEILEIGNIEKAGKQTNFQMWNLHTKQSTLWLFFYINTPVKKVLLFTDSSSLFFSGQSIQKTSTLDTFAGGWESQNQKQN